MSTKGTLVLTTSAALVVALAVLLWLVFWAFGDGSGSGGGIGPAGSNNGSAQGIQVHGQWTIDIREPDGRLVSHHEFSNALTSGSGKGDQLLAKMLNGEQSPGPWFIELGNFDAAKAPCRISDSINLPCFVAESNLSTSVPTSGTNANSLVLIGTGLADKNGEIDFVNAALDHCAGTTAPADCTPSAGGFTTFTSTTLSGLDVVTVLAGQSLNVTVIISFS